MHIGLPNPTVRAHSSVADDHNQMSRIIDMIKVELDKPVIEASGLYMLLGELIEISRDHFAHEEQVMTAMDYPDRDIHITNHRYLDKCLADYVAICESGALTMGKDAGKHIRDWFEFHTKNVDERFNEWRAHETAPANNHGNPPAA